MIKIDVKYIWAKRLNSILKTWFFTTVQTFKLDFLENMKSADGTFLQATVEFTKVKCFRIVLYQNYRRTAIKFAACCCSAAEEPKYIFIKERDETREARDIA